MRLWVRAAVGEGRAERRPSVRQGMARRKLSRAHRGRNWRTAASRRCGSRPLLQLCCAWRSSYESPGRGHRHGRCSIRRQCQKGLVLVAAVVSLLSGLGLSTGVILAILLPLFGCRCFGGRRRLLELLHSRLDLVHEADVLVVLHHAGGGGVVRTS